MCLCVPDGVKQDDKTAEYLRLSYLEQRGMMVVRRGIAWLDSTQRIWNNASQTNFSFSLGRFE